MGDHHLFGRVTDDPLAGRRHIEAAAIAFAVAVVQSDHVADILGQDAVARLRLAADREVLQLRNEVLGRTVGLQHERDGQAHPDQAAVRALIAFVHLVAGEDPRHELGQ